MRSIDIHAHYTPQAFVHAVRQGREWHGLPASTSGGAPRNFWTPEQRLADMDSLGVDIHVVSTAAQFYCYDIDPAVATLVHRDSNDEVHQMTMDHPDRFAGLCALP
ncbi:MAG: hypothetical protein ACE5Q6_27160, partial [Dehalococcoidia bacterium]